MPAATSAPNAKIRITSVIGSDSVRALAKSSLKLLFSALSALASPACWILQAGVGPLSGRGRGQRRADLVCRRRLVAADLEADQRRVPVAGDLTAVGGRQRRAQVLHGPDRRQPPDDIATAAWNCGSRDRQLAALDQHLLAGRLRELRVEDLVRAAGLADAVVVAGDVLGADRAAQRDRRQRRTPSTRRWPIRRCRALHVAARAVRFLRCIALHLRDRFEPRRQSPRRCSACRYGLLASCLAASPTIRGAGSHTPTPRGIRIPAAAADRSSWP